MVGLIHVGVLANTPMRVSTTIPPTPRQDFERRLQTIFAGDPVTFNTLLSQMPLFLWALRDESWGTVGQLIMAALQATIISQQQYDDIKAAGEAANVPLELA